MSETKKVSFWVNGDSVFVARDDKGFYVTERFAPQVMNDADFRKKIALTFDEAPGRHVLDENCYVGAEMIDEIELRVA